MRFLQNLAASDQFMVVTEGKNDRRRALQKLRAAGFSMWWNDRPTDEDLDRWAEDNDGVLWGSKSSRHIVGSPGIYAPTSEISEDEILKTVSVGN